LGDETVFADVLARLYELRADYRAATGEYLSWVVQDIRRLNYVDSRLAQYPQDDGVMEMVAETLHSAAVAEPEQVAYRHLYGHHLLRLGEPELAYEEFLVLNEKEKSSSGKVLLQFARRCSELGYYAAAIRACREVSTRYPESPTARQAQLAEGDNLAIMERYQEALTAYSKLAREHQETAEAREALFARGEIYFLYLGDLDSALATYRILASGAGDGVRAEDAGFRVGDCLVVRMDLEGARTEYDRLAQKSRQEDVREKAAYKLAELTMLEGEFKEAQRQFDDLVKTFPRGFYVNDALVQSMFLDEALSGGQEEVLGAFVTALGLDRRRDYRGALEVYQRALEEFPESFLGSDILFEMARAQETIGQYQQALADLERLIADYPQSRLCPEAQRRIGAIYELRLGDLSLAIKAYEQVLSTYPRYLFLDEVRRKIHQLRGRGTG
ncbi:tol-pal system YbgF family protein, partial [Candidatus Zixiibacteriota bacterium]